ncbi:MAG: serine/threonine protein kinase, partial [Pseudomonadota bacterium]|nr:serine/threonine protein kinase [Pseudomonadota bacterium]
MNDPEDMPFPLPDIAGYRLEKVLGAGNMATVYLAVQASLERKVALKVMAARLANDPLFCERFQREGRKLAKLAKHPHIVTVYDVGVCDPYRYMAMEYVEGGATLEDRITRGLAAEQATRLLRQVAGALGHAHRAGIIHRDIKPANILLYADDSAVLSDFGIAWEASEGTLTQAGHVIGTPRYMSPEQIQDLEMDGRSDLYSLGLVYFEMLTGTRPNPPAPGATYTLPARLATYQGLVDGLLAWKPEDRFPDAGALIDAIDHLLPRQ